MLRLLLLPIILPFGYILGLIGFLLTSQEERDTDRIMDISHKISNLQDAMVFQAKDQATRNQYHARIKHLMAEREALMNKYK